MIARRLAPLAAVAALLLAFTACSLIPGAKRLGVSAGSNGGVRVHFVPCPGEVVTKVAYLAHVGAGFSSESGNDTPADDPEDDEELVWLASAPSGSRVETFEIGVAPPGFTEELALSEAPAAVDAPAAWVAYRGDGVGSFEIGFDVDDLEAGSILTLDGRKDLATFEREGAESC